MIALSMKSTWSWLMLALALRAVSAPGQFPGTNAHRAFGGIQPCISPDGRTIALSFQGAICRMPSEGGTLTRLTRGEGTDTDPAWSPDGKQIAFINSPAFNTGRLRLIDAANGSAIPLAKEITARGSIEFDPQGKRLLGWFGENGQAAQLRWYELAAGKLTPLQISSLHEHQRAWMKWSLSPGGRTILFATFQDLPGEQSGNNGPAADLWQASSEGGAPQKIGQWPSRIFGLRWNPDGQSAFIVTDRGGAYNDLWLIPIDNVLAGARQITFGQADEDWPSISQDGGFLVHTENQEHATALVRMNLKTGQKQVLEMDRLDLGEPAGALHLSFVDGEAGGPTVCRVSLKQEGGKFQFPLGALYRFTSGTGHFYARGRADLNVPAGQYLLRVWRGPEYAALQRQIEIGPGESRDLRVELKRWVNMPERGWYSGENHVHANYGYGAWHNSPSTIRDQCEGENLHVANVMVANSDGDGVFDRQYFLGYPDPLSAAHTIIYWNEEFRSTIWCGFRIPGAAGTDVFLNRIQCYPPGWGRCFVRLTNALTYADWIRGQKAGHSFVTTGPMLEWDVDAFGPGGVGKLSSARTVKVTARTSSQFPLKSLELVLNGSVIHTATPKNEERELTLEQPVKLEQSGWLAVRCTAENRAFPEAGRTLSAHSNPVFVEFPGHPLNAKSDAGFFIAWIDRLESDLKTRDRMPVGLEQVNSQLGAARAIYRKLASTTER